MKNKRRLFVVLFLVLYILYLAISLRGQYLQVLQIGLEYTEVFMQNLKYKAIVIISNFIIVFLSTYITTLFIKKGLKKFFVEEKKDMPKLPNKSMALVCGVIISMFTSNLLVEKVALFVNSTLFGFGDPVFGADIGYYIFQQPFLEIILYYLIGLVIFLSAYIAAYYIIVFNKYFKEGINVETLKKNTFIKQLLVNVVFIVLLISGLTFVNIQNVVLEEFIQINNGTNLVGAGLSEITVKTWGNRIFAVIIIISAILTVIQIKKQKFKKVPYIIGIIPAYLVLQFIVMVGFNLIYVNNNKLDNEKTYIDYNIEYTKKAYDIEIDELEIKEDEDFASAISNNKDVTQNINLLNEDTILASLEEYQTNSGYYKFTSAKENLYKIGGEERLLYLSPREIITNDTRTYKNKTYEYTHGYGFVLTSAANTDENGKVEHVQSGFEEQNDLLNVEEKRIYFGLETNDAIIIEPNIEEEYDYPKSNLIVKRNSYKGKAGLNLNFIDRFILAINEKNMRIAFSGKNTENSKIITKRNIIDRAKTIMPYLIYDEEPYLIVNDDGNLVWVIDAYTTTNNYPYSQRTTIEVEEEKKDINYIRNSVKVLVDAYDGTIKFYITDETDPIIIAYRNLYKNLFKSAKYIPEGIKNKFVYSEYLYNIQAEMLKTYHNTQSDILYRADDIWDIAKESTSTVTAMSGTYIEPYYTMLKTIDSEQAQMGLVVPYTVSGKQNVISYLVGTNDGKLKLYRFSTDSAILGTLQLDNLINEDETISSEIEKLNVTGSKIIKNTIIVPIDNTLIYVVPIYQVMLNETNQVPTLKKVVVACENKIAIGENLEKAFNNLLSQEAVSFEVQTTDSKDGLIEEIINANNNLKNSLKTNNWEMFGKDLATLEELINKLEIMYKEENEEEIVEEQIENEIEENIENNVLIQ